MAKTKVILSIETEATISLQTERYLSRSGEYILRFLLKLEGMDSTHVLSIHQLIQLVLIGQTALHEEYLRVLEAGDEPRHEM